MGARKSIGGMAPRKSSAVAAARRSAPLTGSCLVESEEETAAIKIQALARGHLFRVIENSDDDPICLDPDESEWDLDEPEWDHEDLYSDTEPLYSEPETEPLYSEPEPEPEPEPESEDQDEFYTRSVPLIVRDQDCEYMKWKLRNPNWKITVRDIFQGSFQPSFMLCTHRKAIEIDNVAVWEIYRMGNTRQWGVLPLAVKLSNEPSDFYYTHPHLEDLRQTDLQPGSVLPDEVQEYLCSQQGIQLFGLCPGKSPKPAPHWLIANTEDYEKQFSFYQQAYRNQDPPEPELYVIPNQPPEPDPPLQTLIQQSHWDQVGKAIEDFKLPNSRQYLKSDINEAIDLLEEINKGMAALEKVRVKINRDLCNELKSVNKRQKKK